MLEVANHRSVAVSSGSFALVLIGLLLALSGVSCAAPAPSAPPVTAAPPVDRALAAESFANEKLWLWQKRLRLENWKIHVKVVRAGELKRRTLGNIHWDADTHSATIKVMNPADYKMPFSDVLNDLEMTVVHELVHLHLSSLPRSEASRSAEEHAVNTLAEALLNLDRRQ